MIRMRMRIKITVICGSNDQYDINIYYHHLILSNLLPLAKPVDQLNMKKQMTVFFMVQRLNTVDNV